MKITIKQIAEKLHKDQQTIRILLQRDMLPFGKAFKKDGSSHYNYVIFPEKFREYCGE